MMSRVTHSPAGILATLALCATLAGCEKSDTTGLGDSGPDGQAQFSREITFEEFQEILEIQGTVRVEIELLPDQLVAREVEVEGPEDVSDEEEIESRIIDINLTGTDCEGTVFLAIEPIEVPFNSDTEFEGEDDDDITCEEFVDRVQTALAAGEEPAVEAERPPLVENGNIVAQAPDDMVFTATEIELEGDDDEAELEINIDMDNLEDCPSGAPEGCLGVLRVLNAPILIIDGVTELEQDLPDMTGEVDFEGIVESVALDSENPDLGSVTLTNGLVIRIVVGTEIKQSGKDERLSSLAEVDAAVMAGAIVEAEGEGVVESTGPITIVAIEVEFEVDDDAEDAPPPGAVEFEDSVTGVDVANRNITLADGTQVHVGTDDIIDPEGDLLTLQQVSDAVNAGAPVRAEGHATVESAGPPAMLVALEIKFQVDD